MNQTYLDTARRLTQVAPLVFMDDTFVLKGGTSVRARHAALVGLEVSFVTRGTVRPVRRASLTPVARDVLMADLNIPLVSLEDAYGGNLVAALDRQHPREQVRADTRRPATRMGERPSNGGHGRRRCAQAGR